MGEEEERYGAEWTGRFESAAAADIDELYHDRTGLRRKLLMQMACPVGQSVRPSVRAMIVRCTS